MGYHLYQPRPPLSDLVAMFWSFEGYTTSHQKERLLPTGTGELVINLRENHHRVYDLGNLDEFNSFTGSVICGIHSRPFVIDTDAQFSVIGVHFKAGGFFPFFPFPASELHNLTVSLEDVWGLQASTLRESLLEEKSPTRRFEVLEAFLSARAVKALARHCAVDYALKAFRESPEIPTVAAVVERTGFSQRRFIEVFTREVGLSPKLYCRIERFQRVIQSVQGKDNVKWLEAALESGFFDQAHFIRDFQQFSGISPSAYLKQRSEHLNHVPIL